MTYSLPIARQIDGVLINAVSELVTKAELGDVQIYVTGLDGSLSVSGPLSALSGHAELQQVLGLQTTALTYIGIYHNGREFLTVERPDGTVHDQVKFQWSSQLALTAVQFAEIVGLAKEKFRELRVDSENSPIRDGVDTAIKARFAELAELQQIAGRITVDAQKHLLRLDERYAERVAKLEANADIERQRLEKAMAAREAAFAEREKALDEREAEIDKTDAKAARRKLRENLQKTLREHGKRFELSSATRSLRLPTAALLLCILSVTAGLTAYSFIDFANTLTNVQAEWWRVAMLSLKQFLFAATFLGFAAYTVRWFEAWSKRHADAEFRFKQLELDIDRASWVVEVAQEWHKDQGKEVPPDLLAQLSRNLFDDSADTGGEHANDVSAALLGAAARFKFTSPAGEIEVDRKGAQKLAKKFAD